MATTSPLNEREISKTEDAPAKEIKPMQIFFILVILTLMMAVLVELLVGHYG